MTGTAGTAGASGAADLLAPRWRGQAGRLEVWYATLTDPVSGLGFWVHHEIVSPTRGPARLHGWAAVFPPEGAPVWERFGPTDIHPGSPVELKDQLQRAEGTGASFSPGLFTGSASRLGWRLEWEDRGEPLLTFPRWAWEKERLPAAHVVPAPDATFTGTLTVDGRVHAISGATGAVAHIYGHGNAKEWGWLHGDLGGGDVIEVVAATSKLRGLDQLPPLGFVQIRAGGRDWPARSALAAPLLRGRLGLPAWSITGVAERRRLRVEVTIPPERSVSIGYEDPDGSRATCVNSEIADAEIVLERWGWGWQLERRWSLMGRAHAEVGRRP